MKFGLAFVGAAVPKLRVGTCILIVPQRNPLVLAKELATLDPLTDGRVDFAPAACSPRPVDGSIPILVGGDTPAAIPVSGVADSFYPGRVWRRARRRGPRTPETKNLQKTRPDW